MSTQKTFYTAKVHLIALFLSASLSAMDKPLDKSLNDARSILHAHGNYSLRLEELIALAHQYPPVFTQQHINVPGSLVHRGIQRRAFDRRDIPDLLQKIKLVQDASIPLDQQDMFGTTALMEASQDYLHAPIVQALLEANASPMMTDNKSRVAMDYALDSDNGDSAARILSAHKTMPLYVHRPTTAFSQEPCSYLASVLMRLKYSAYQMKGPDIIQNLVSAGASVTVEDVLTCLRNCPYEINLLVPGCSLNVLHQAREKAPDALRDAYPDKESDDRLQSKLNHLDCAIILGKKRNSKISRCLAKALPAQACIRIEDRFAQAKLVRKTIKEYLG